MSELDDLERRIRHLETAQRVSRSNIGRGSVNGYDLTGAFVFGLGSSNETYYDPDFADLGFSSTTLAATFMTRLAGQRAVLVEGQGFWDRWLADGTPVEDYYALEGNIVFGLGYW